MKKIRSILIGTMGMLLPVVSSFAQSDVFTPSSNTKTLVAYFSATGNTRAVATRIAELTGADIYEIEPSRPYAANPYDDSQLIQNEAYNDLRPSVANLPSKEHIAGYDTIYVGSPLWWHQPAMVVCTFLDMYDLSGKVVVPFITYGSTTYLNEGMQKLFKCTPNSIHVPAQLPEDIDPDNIREPQNDDAGIDVPNRASQVEGWLKRMKLDNTTGVHGLGSDDASTDIQSYGDGVHVSIGNGTGMLAIFDMTGRTAYQSAVDNNMYVALNKGMYIVNVQSDKERKSKKIVID